jgi:hypothetical protein
MLRRNQERGITVGSNLRYGIPDHLSRVDIKIASWFIHDDKLGFPEQGHADRDLSFLTLR